MPKKRPPHARPIRTRRDYAGASAAAKRLASEAGRDSGAEQRLQALLREMDRFEETDDDPEAPAREIEDYAGPRRRWSDDAAGPD